MGDNNKRTGSCVCGAVKYTVNKEINNFSACHCEMCRRWGSSAFLAIECGGDVQFEGEDNITRYKSSDWAERGFCKSCGSNLFYALISTGHYHLSVGTLDDQNGLEMTNQIFIDKKPDNYGFSNTTPVLTEEEAFGLYTSRD